MVTHAVPATGGDTSRFQQHAIRVASLSAVVLLVLTALAFWSSSQSEKAAAERRTERRIFNQLTHLLSYLKDAETGQRGYLLTGDPSFLTPFATGSVEATSALAALDREPSLAGEDREGLDRIKKLVQAEFAFLGETIVHRYSLGLDSAVHEVRTGRGKVLMDSLRVEISALENRLPPRIALLEARATRLNAITMRVIPVIGVLAALLLWLAGKALRRELERRARAEQAARIAATEAEDLYDHAPCGYHSLDADGKFVRVNGTEAKWLKRERSELLGRPFSEFLTPASAAKVAKNFPVFVQTGEVSGLELELVARDGTIRPVSLSATAVRDADGKYLWSRTTLHDIASLKAAQRALEVSNAKLEERVADRTSELSAANEELQSAVEELRVAEEELRQQNDDLLKSQMDLERSERRLRTALDELGALVSATPQALVALDAEGNVLNWYGGAERLFGWTAEEVLGRPLPVVPPDLEEEFKARRTQVLAGGEVAQYEMPARHKGGSLVTVTVSTAPLHDSLERISGLVVVFSDLSDRLRAEQERRAREVAEAANQAKSVFLANMSHELRTPLNAIIGFSELLEDETFGTLNERQRRYVANVLTSGRHLLDLINDILDLAKVEAGRMVLDPTTFDVAHAVLEARRIVEPLASGKRLTLQAEVATELPPLTADRAKFKQILYNLLSNAIKFTPEGGTVKVTVDQVEPPAGGEPSVLRLSVTDTGIGIAASDHDRVFQEFEQVDSSYARAQPGTGLGLALTRRLVMLHGGRIMLASELGRGSTFTVVLPFTPPEMLAAGPVPKIRVPADTNGRPLILVVEDDPVAGELLGHYLTSNGYAVAHAWNGAQALEAAQELQPAAITLDILLPDEDGLEILSRLRSLAETRGIPVVVVSITDDRELGLSLGAVDWLVKPVQRDHLLKALEAAIPPHPMADPVRVLVVDDHRETVDLLAETLSRRGFAPLKAHGGLEALEVAGRERPDAIVLDLVMPGVGGVEVVRQLRARPETREIPVLVFTFKDLDEEEREVLSGNVQTVVSKSEAGALLEALQRLAHRSGNSRRAAEAPADPEVA